MSTKVKVKLIIHVVLRCITLKRELLKTTKLHVSRVVAEDISKVLIRITQFYGYVQKCVGVCNDLQSTCRNLVNPPQKN